MSIAIKPRKFNRIRALRTANPLLDEEGLARLLKVHPNEVGLTLGRNPTLRIQSVAK